MSALEEIVGGTRFFLISKVLEAILWFVKNFTFLIIPTIERTSPLRWKITKGHVEVESSNLNDRVS